MMNFIESKKDFRA